MMVQYRFSKCMMYFKKWFYFFSKNLYEFTVHVTDNKQKRRNPDYLYKFLAK